MGQLFLKEIEFFKEIADNVNKAKEFEQTAIIEVGNGTAELFSKVDRDFNMLVGVELNQDFIDLGK